MQVLYTNGMRIAGKPYAIDLISRADYAAHLHNDVTGWRQNIAVFAV